jgi:hypothetical protein
MMRRTIAHRMLVWTGLMLVLPGGLLAQRPSDSDLYCAGFYSRQAVGSGLAVIGSEDGGFKNEYANGDYIYLNRGTNALSSPGGQYLLVRPTRDANLKESFPGQHLMVARMGTLYREIARIELKVLHEQTATAQILWACEPVLAGDLAIPLSNRPAPSYKSQWMTDRFAPASGKATGVIASSKDFDQSLGQGKIVYVNLGTNQGVQVGSYLRVFRTPLNSAQNDPYADAARNYPSEPGVTPTPPLTRAEMATLPRSVVGEVLVLSVQEDSATGIISFSRMEVSVGDEVELE